MVTLLGSFVVPDAGGRIFVSADGSTLVLDVGGRVYVSRRGAAGRDGVASSDALREWPDGATSPGAPGRLGDRVLAVADDGSDALLSADSGTRLSVRSTADGSEISGFGVVTADPDFYLYGAYLSGRDVVVGWNIHGLWRLAGGELRHVLPALLLLAATPGVLRDETSVAFVHQDTVFIVSSLDGGIIDRIRLCAVDTRKRFVVSADARGDVFVCTDGSIAEIVDTGPVRGPNRVFVNENPVRVALSEEGDEWCSVGRSGDVVLLGSVGRPEEKRRRYELPGLLDVRHHAGVWTAVRATREDESVRVVVEALL